jgi:hypothetical protein
MSTSMIFFVRLKLFKNNFFINHHPCCCAHCYSICNGTHTCNIITTGKNSINSSLMKSIYLNIAFVSQLASQGFWDPAMLIKGDRCIHSLDKRFCAVPENDILKIPLAVFKSFNFFFYYFYTVFSSFSVCSAVNVEVPLVNSVKSFVQFEISLENSKPFSPLPKMPVFSFLTSYP